MIPREIAPGVSRLGVVDWDGRMFDAFVPLPEGTSYNCYLVKGAEKTVLIDTVDTKWSDELFTQLGDAKVDVVVSLHAEQDHSASLPLVLERFPEARLICSRKALGVLTDHLAIDKDRIDRVKDGDTLDLGGKTLQFIDTPWVHWPETMSAYCPEDKILFSCDFFGSHLATSDLFADDEGRVYQAAKYYFAHIMMPFRKFIEQNLEKVDALDLAMIAPSHGPVFRNPQFIVDAYKDWVSAPPKNMVVIPYVSMHDSTRQMVAKLVDALIARGVKAEPFDLTITDPGQLATALVDAGTIVFGSGVVLDKPHPLAASAAYLTDLLKPKAKFVSMVGSYSWSRKALPLLMDMLADLEAEVLEPCVGKGAPVGETFEGVEAFAQKIADSHAEAGLA